MPDKKFVFHTVTLALSIGFSLQVQAKTFGPEQFINTNVARHAFFYVGGEYKGEGDKELMEGQMYVEAWAPKKVTKEYPIVFFHGLGQTGTNWMATPDGRAGWADYFVNQGYAVYMIDQPDRGRSGWEIDNKDKFRTTNVNMAQKLFTDSQEYKSWPQSKEHTQWPGASSNPGKRGDPVFDAFYGGIVPSLADNKKSEELVKSAASQLLDKIGPAILLTHSQAGLFGWSIADARPSLVKGIVAIEPSGPPFQNATQSKRELPWGITNIPLSYTPSVNSPEEISIEQQSKPDGPNLSRCWKQKEPARKLTNLQNIPVLLVTSEASYHAPYDHCTASFLKQAGVPITFWRLEDQGIKGNGHLMMLEKNNEEIASKLNGWIIKEVIK